MVQNIYSQMNNHQSDRMAINVDHNDYNQFIEMVPPNISANMMNVQNPIK